VQTYAAVEPVLCTHPQAPLCSMKLKKEGLGETIADNTQHTTHNTQHTTHNTQHTTHNTQHTTHNNKRCFHTNSHIGESLQVKIEYVAQ